MDLGIKDMFNVREYFKLVLEHPKKQIIYDALTGEMFYFDTKIRKNNPERFDALIKDRLSDRFISLNEYNPNTIRDLMNNFIKKSDHYQDFVSNGYVDNETSLTNILKISKKINQYNDLLDYCVSAESYYIYQMCIGLDIKEDEASEETYRLIKELLVELKNKKYERYFSDKNLFRINRNSTRFSFILLGHLTETHGLSIYPSENNEDIYKYIYKMSSTNIDSRTATSLMEFISFYFDDDAKEMNIKNPYNDNSLMSVTLYPGRFSRNYLTESLGIYCLNVLKSIIYVLSHASSEGFLEEVDNDRFDLICYDEDFDDICYVASQDEDAYLDDSNCFYNFDEEYYFPPQNYTFNKKETWSFTLRRVEDYFLIEENEDRIGRYGYLGIFANESTKKIEAMVLFNPDLPRPLEGLANAITSQFEGKSLPGTIITNNELDFMFIYRYFLLTENEKKRPDVRFIPHETAADEAYDIFLEEYDNADIGDEDA